MIVAAVRAFMAKGFAGTTLPDLEVATGLDRSSLYSSFGGKSGLYELATSRYLDAAEASLFEPLFAGSDDGIADVGVFLDRLRENLSPPEAEAGCLIVNDIAAGAAPAAAARYREILRSGVKAALERAGVDDAGPRSALVASAVIGINLIGKHNSDRTEVLAAVDALQDQVEAWRR